MQALPNDQQPGNAGDSPVVGLRTVDIAVGILLLAGCALLALDNWRIGARWAEDGPQAGLFPFALALLGCVASLVVVLAAWRTRPGRSFVGVDSGWRVLKVFIPTLAFIAGTQFLGIYVASLLFVAGFMMFVGRSGAMRSILTAVVFAAFLFFVFEVQFQVVMPKGPLEAALGY
jgi:hypothetical protein